MESTNDGLQVACPHCGFLNFAISAYCGRCERPLRASARPDQAPESLATLLSPEPASTPPPLPPRPARATGKPPLIRPALAAVPPPGPPPSLEVRPPAALPIALPPGAPKRAAKQARKRRRTRSLAKQPVAYAVALPSTRRVLAAELVDFAVVVGVGLIVALAEALLLEDGGGAGGDFLDSIANWMHSHPGPTWHGLAIAVLFAFGYGISCARGSGRSLGRVATDTVLVHQAGNPITWRMAAVRALIGGLSLALFGAGFFWPIVDPQRRTWQDLWAGTVLVHRRVHPAPAPLPPIPRASA